MPFHFSYAFSVGKKSIFTLLRHSIALIGLLDDETIFFSDLDYFPFGIWVASFSSSFPLFENLTTWHKLKSIYLTCQPNLMIYLRCSLKECYFPFERARNEYRSFRVQACVLRRWIAKMMEAISRFLLEVYSCYFEFRDRAIVFLYLPACCTDRMTRSPGNDKRVMNAHPINDSNRILPSGSTSGHGTQKSMMNPILVWATLFHRYVPLSTRLFWWDPEEQNPLTCKKHNI